VLLSRRVGNILTNRKSKLGLTMATIQFFNSAMLKASDPIRFILDRPLVLHVADLWLGNKVGEHLGYALYRSEDEVEIALFKIEWEPGKFTVQTVMR
jgi:hypothetical protein